MFNGRPTLRAPLNQRHIVPPTFFQRVSKSDLISIIAARVTATFRSTLEPFSGQKKKNYYQGLEQSLQKLGFGIFRKEQHLQTIFFLLSKWIV